MSAPRRPTRPPAAPLTPPIPNASGRRASTKPRTSCCPPLPATRTPAPPPARSASAFIAEIARDPGAFDRLARDNSACDSRANGGRLGQIAAGDTVPEFEAALAALPVGGVTPEPVATRFGLHVIRLDARAEGALLPFEAVHPRIRDMLERAAWAREARALVARLLAEARVSGVDFPGAPGRAA